MRTREIGKVNTSKFTYKDVYGGKTIYNIKVKIINE